MPSAKFSQVLLNLSFLFLKSQEMSFYLKIRSFELEFETHVLKVFRQLSCFNSLWLHKTFSLLLVQICGASQLPLWGSGHRGCRGTGTVWGELFCLLSLFSFLSQSMCHVFTLLPLLSLSTLLLTKIRMIYLVFEGNVGENIGRSLSIYSLIEPRSRYLFCFFTKIITLWLMLIMFLRRSPTNPYLLISLAHCPFTLTDRRCAVLPQARPLHIRLHSAGGLAQALHAARGSRSLALWWF